MITYADLSMYTSCLPSCGPGSVVGRAANYGLDGPGIESRWRGEILGTCPDRPWRQLSLLYNEHRVFPWGKERPGRDAVPSPPSSAVCLDSVELYLYSPSGLYGPVQSLSVCTRVTLTFTFNFLPTRYL
jgi:hypothetical protein